MREIATNYYSASGPSIEDCYYLGQRFDAEHGYKPREAECWVIRIARGETNWAWRCDFGSTAYLVKLWRSRTGAVWVAEMGNRLHYNPDLRKKSRDRSWKEKKVGSGGLAGVWGIDDKHVYAYGPGGMWMWNGRAFGDVSPELGVEAMHGTAPDRLIAGGDGGQVATFDGDTWTEIPTDTEDRVLGVFAGATQLYAVTRGGALLAGTKQLATVARVKTPLYDVAEYDGTIYVAGGAAGLLAKKAKKLVVIDKAIRATSFDARERLLIGCSDGLAAIDGKFRRFDDDILRRALADKRLCDL